MGRDRLKMMSVRMPRELIVAGKRRALDEDRTFQEVMRDSLAAYLRRPAKTRKRRAAQPS